MHELHVSALQTEAVVQRLPLQQRPLPYAVLVAFSLPTVYCLAAAD